MDKKVTDKVKEITSKPVIVKGEFKLIESEEEYNKEYAWFESEMKTVKKLMFSQPIKAYDRFMECLLRCEGIGLFPKEHCDKLRQTLIDGLNDANIQEKIKRKFEKFKSRFKK